MRACASLLNFEKELFVHVSTLESRASKGNEKAAGKGPLAHPRPPDAAGAHLPEEQVHAGRQFLHAGCGDRPLLWRLDYYDIDLSKNAAPLLKYAERIFSRPAYIEALTPSEKVIA